MVYGSATATTGNSGCVPDATEYTAAMSRDRPIGVCLHDVFAAVACWLPAAVFTVTAYAAD